MNSNVNILSIESTQLSADALTCLKQTFGQDTSDKPYILVGTNKRIQPNESIPIISIINTALDIIMMRGFNILQINL